MAGFLSNPDFRTEETQRLAARYENTCGIVDPADKLLALKTLSADVADFLSQEESVRDGMSLGKKAAMVAVPSSMSMSLFLTGAALAGDVSTGGLFSVFFGLMSVTGGVGMFPAALYSWSKMDSALEHNRARYDLQFLDHDVALKINEQVERSLNTCMDSLDLKALPQSPKVHEVLAQFPNLREKFIQATKEERQYPFVFTASLALPVAEPLMLDAPQIQEQAKAGQTARVPPRRPVLDKACRKP